MSNDSTNVSAALPARYFLFISKEQNADFIDEFDLVFASAFNVRQYREARLAIRVNCMCTYL